MRQWALLVAAALWPVGRRGAMVSAYLWLCSSDAVDTGEALEACSVAVRMCFGAVALGSGQRCKGKTQGCT
jgi:hypothetical protein